MYIYIQGRVLIPFGSMELSFLRRNGAIYIIHTLLCLLIKFEWSDHWSDQLFYFYSVSYVIHYWLSLGHYRLKTSDIYFVIIVPRVRLGFPIWEQSIFLSKSDKIKSIQFLSPHFLSYFNYCRKFFGIVAWSTLFQSFSIHLIMLWLRSEEKKKEICLSVHVLCVNEYRDVWDG